MTTNTPPSEKQKMLNGQAYSAFCPELMRERRHAKSICHQFNHSPTYQPGKQQKLLKSLLACQGRFYIEPPFHCDYGYNIHIGNGFYANHNLVILDACPVIIGERVLIGPNVMISTATHPIDPQERQTTELAKPIKIGHDVWIGGNVSILPGVTIGDGCVVGAGSVVNRDLPAFTVAAGNPCRVKKAIPAQQEDK